MAEEKKKTQEEPRMVTLDIGGRLVEAQVDKDGKVSIPEDVSKIFSAGMDVISRANEINESVTESMDNANDTPLTANGDSVASNFTSLPMRDLIGAPLLAAAESQQQLASVAWDFYQRIAFADDKKSARTLDFTIERPVTQDGGVTMMKQEVKAPFIGLVPIPSLLIDNIDIDFQMEVTATNTETSKTQSEVSTSMSYKSWFGLKAELNGKVTSSRENTRKTDQTAKYQVHVTASQQPQAEGLSKLMDIMNSCIQPIDAK